MPYVYVYAYIMPLGLYFMYIVFYLHFTSLLAITIFTKFMTTNLNRSVLFEAGEKDSDVKSKKENNVKLAYSIYPPQSKCSSRRRSSLRI